MKGRFIQNIKIEERKEREGNRKWNLEKAWEKQKLFITASTDKGWEIILKEKLKNFKFFPSHLNLNYESNISLKKLLIWLFCLVA